MEKVKLNIGDICISANCKKEDRDNFIKFIKQLEEEIRKSIIRRANLIEDVYLDIIKDMEKGIYSETAWRCVGHKLGYIKKIEQEILDEYHEQHKAHKPLK